MGDVYRIEISISIKDNTDPGVSQAKNKLNAFDKASQRTQERLEQMNKTRYQIILEALDRASSIVGTVSSKARSIAGKTFSFTMKVIDLATAPLRSLWNFVTSIQGAILGATGAFAGIYKPMDIAADFEQTQIAFETMLKSAEKAQQFLEKASEFANKTPFEFPELINSSKLLMAFGFEADKVLDMLKTIGDTASGLGAGSEGIDRITRALGQMRAKGRAQAEELLQLQELGVPANQILQEELGLTGEQVANIGKESIEAAKVIDALLRGMDKRFGGMMANQSRTAKGMVSTIKDTLQNSLLRPWGQGLWEGIKPGLEKLTTWIDENQDIITEWGEAWKKAGANISKWVMARVDGLKSSIQRMVNSQEWKDAKNFGEKLKIAWDKIIAQPFNEWWNSTGKAWLADKAGKIGEGIGTALNAGLLAILGIDAKGAIEDGTSIGASFAEGFTRGFDGKKVGEAILNAIKGVFKDAATLLPGGEKPSSTSWLSASAIGIGIAKIWPLLTGIFKLGTGVFKLGSKAGKGLLNLFGKGSKDGVPAPTGSIFPDSFITSTMAVTASVVYINGPTVGGGGSGGKIINSIPSLPGGGSATIPKLPGGGSTLALPSAAGAAGKVINTVKLANGTYAVSGSAITTGLAKLGVALGSKATTVGGAAAAGTAGIAGIIGAILGLGSAGIDVYQGIKASKAGNSKFAKDEYVTAGTKAGMVGTGALIGTAILPGLGTLIGAGIGGAAALLTGDKAGKALSDATDEGGWMANIGEAIGNFFTDTLPKGWNKFWGGVGNFFTNSIPTWWNGLTEKASAFFTETIPEKWNELWNGVGDFFAETVPYALGYAAGTIEVFFTEDVPRFFSDLWSGISTFFTSTLPTWTSNVWNGHIVPFFTVDIPNFFGGIWSNISTFFTSTLPTWATDTWNNSIVPFFTQDIPNFFGGLWTGITTFFTSTLPAWASSVWDNNIVPFFTQTIPGFFADLWSSVTGFFTQTLPTLASNVWGSIKSFFTDTIPSFFSGLWDKVSGSFSAGYSAAKGGSVAEHAWGGIMTKPHMGIVAENGAEGIIPLSPSKRQRGLDLWQRTGELLGVRVYEDGGIVGEEPDEIPVASATGKAGQNVTIKVEVKAEPKFTIEGSGDTTNENKVLAVLKAHIREMTDDIGDELAERLARIFANMPLEGGAES